MNVNIYIVPGFVIGSIYAIAASGLVLTYATSGVLNLAYGAIAYVNATLFWYLTSHGVDGLPAAAICVLGFSPLLGVILWRFLFRLIVHLGLIAGLIASIGLAVALPAAIDLILPHEEVYYARGIVTPGFTIHRWGPFLISTDQFSGVVGALAIAVLLFWLLRYTRIGLRMRAVFDNRSVASLSGVSPDTVSTFSWALSASLAGLGGILLAPLLSLTSDAFLTVTVASLAAALVGGLRSIGITFVAALAIGVLGSVIAAINTGDNLFAVGIQPSLPFIVMAVALFVRRRPLFHGSPGKVVRFVDTAQRPLWAAVLRLWPIAVVIIVTPLVLNDYWIGVVALGFVYAVILLSFTVALGDAGMIPLGQAAIVGIGAFTAGALASTAGVPLLFAIMLGGLAALVAGAVLAFAGGRLGTLEFAFLSLAFALFCVNFLFNWTAFVPINGTNFPTSILGIAFDSPQADLYLFGGCSVIALFIYWLFRRHAAGFVVNATRMNVSVAEATGINSRNSRVLALALSSFFAGVGGALLGVYQLHISQSDVATEIGLLWLAVVVVMGIRTPAGAVVGGLSLALFPALLSQVLPIRYGPVPTILFGTGALALASDPRGVVSYQKDMAIRWFSKARVRIRATPVTEPGG